MVLLGNYTCAMHRAFVRMSAEPSISDVTATMDLRLPVLLSRIAVVLPSVVDGAENAAYHFPCSHRLPLMPP